VAFLVHQEENFQHKKLFKELTFQGASRWRKHLQGEIKERNFGGSLGSD
jgi:hypothetical protein